MRITISGPPGSGKTTACRNLSEALGYEAVVFGSLFRQKAADMNISVAELGKMAEQNPEIDREIDSEILRIAESNEDIILESRLSAYLTKRNGIDAFRILIRASPEVRAERICGRESCGYDTACTETAEREKSEAKRYMKYYGIDLGDLSVYDLIVDTDNLAPEQVTAVILGAINDRMAG
ncbi:MAG: (d)CMP kinase [Candidatus Methanomethylophilaceae archaeon]|jgi:predicted cytidylate kinase